MCLLTKYSLLAWPPLNSTCNSRRTRSWRTLVTSQPVRSPNRSSTTAPSVSIAVRCCLWCLSRWGIYVLPINYNYFLLSRVDHPIQRNQSVHGARCQKWIRHVSKIKQVLTKFSLGVYVGAGSRHDSLGTSGASHVLRSMLSRGTASRSKADFATEVEQMGGVFAGESGREQCSVKLTVHKADLGKAVELLGDAVSNASLDPAELELLKQELASDHDVNHKQY